MFQGGCWVGINMEVTLDYGKCGLPVTIPDGHDITLVAMKDVSALVDPQAGLSSALDRPICYSASGSRPVSGVVMCVPAK